MLDVFYAREESYLGLLILRHDLMFKLKYMKMEVAYGLASDLQLLTADTRTIKVAEIVTTLNCFRNPQAP